jgi:hypothetical protein
MDGPYGTTRTGTSSRREPPLSAMT